MKVRVYRPSFDGANACIRVLVRKGEKEPKKIAQRAMNEYFSKCDCHFREQGYCEGKKKDAMYQKTRWLSEVVPVDHEDYWCVFDSLDEKGFALW